MKNKEIVNIWLSGNSRKLKSNNVFTDGKAIFSYGYHFIIAFRISYKDFLFCSDNYSTSTGRHKGYVLNELNSRNKNIIYCSQEEIQRAYKNPESPIIIEKTKNSKDINYALDIFKEHWHNLTTQCSPFKKKKLNEFYLKMVEDAETLEKERRLGTVKIRWNEGEYTMYAIRKVNKEITLTNLYQKYTNSCELESVLDKIENDPETITTLTKDQIEEIKTHLLIRNIKKK